MKIWEVHSLQFEGDIRTTPEGDADIAGLVVSEKAYLLAVREFRPAQLVKLVRDEGAQAAAAILIAHYSQPEVIKANAGRGLIAARGHSLDPMVRRSDEEATALATGRQERAKS
ncbi:MAG: hypothetical protein C0506_06735 [Anaerolinea sp.]|nr:hypothetical protein [Anaerolinea sp.]